MKRFVQLVLLLSVASALGAARAQTVGVATPTPEPTAVAPATGMVPGSTDEIGSTHLSASDRAFFQHAAIGGMSEVAEGKMAAQQGTDPDVRKFGERMVTDHDKANEELKQLAQAKGVMLPVVPDVKNERSLDDLKAKQGGDFDRAYAKQEVTDHKKTIALFRKAAKSKDSDIAMFAQNTLPTLLHHLEMARALKGG